MKSYKVFFENRYITISAEPDRIQKYGLFHRFHNKTELYEAISSFKTGTELSMNIFGINIVNLWNSFLDYFTFVEAAGGLVRHSLGYYLFIVRNGRWDLPKGHISTGETPEACALREVEEECGIKGHTIVKALQSSFHTWEYEGVSYLKETYWFLMNYDGDMLVSPQETEGITDARWLRPESVSIIRQSAWHSLTDLINSTILS